MNTQKQIILIVALFFLTVGACAGYAVIDLPYRTELQADWHFEESVERGALLYANNCRTCHGNAGEGFVGPRVNRDDWRDQDPLQLEANQHLINRTLTCGRAGTLMPAWLVENGGSLNERQLEHLVNFLTAPSEEGVVDESGNPTSAGWLHAVEFAHNLNHELTAVVPGETLQTIASSHSIGVEELAAANDLTPDQFDALLRDGAEVTLPAVESEPDGGTYRVEGANVTIRRVAERTFFGAARLAELNGLNYDLSFEDLRFTLLDDDGNPLPGLLHEQVIALPEGSTYTAIAGDTIESIAEQHGITPDELVALNEDQLGELEADEQVAPPDEDGNIPEVILDLPQVDEYTVQAATWDDVADGYGNVTGASLAEANGLTTDDVLRAGQQLSLPEDAFGTAPPDAINPGTACVQFTVPQSIFDAITGEGDIGGGEEFEGTVVAEDSTRFLQTEIILPPDTEVAITFDNRDEVNPHNIQFFASEEPGEGDLLTGCTSGCADDSGDAVRTDISTGPIQQRFTFTTPGAGSYGYNCQVHPNMVGTLVIEEGAEVPEGAQP